MFATLLVVLCAIALFFAFLLLPGDSALEQQAPFWGVNHAHRGLHDAERPENSLAAFTAAVEAGYGIELDIQLSQDGEVVVFHDDDLERVCGVKGRVDSKPLSELKNLRLLKSEQRIPLLTEVLALVDSKVPLIIELKTGPRNKQLCESAWKILRQYDGDICVESFDPRIVHWFKKNVPGLLRGQLSAKPKALGGGAKGFVVGTLLCNFLGRPHFIAYQIGRRPFTVQLAERFAMKVAWTARPGDNIVELERDNDALIFEGYTPEPRFAELPPHPDTESRDPGSSEKPSAEPKKAKAPDENLPEH